MPTRLEFYYVHLVVGAANLEVTASTAQQHELSYSDAHIKPHASGQAEMLSYLQRMLTQFNAMRKLARDTMWYSMTSLLSAVAARIISSAMQYLEDPLTMLGALAAVLIFGVAIVSVHVTVRTFRAAYRPFLAEWGHSW